MKTILLQVPAVVDSLGVDLAQTSEPVEKTLSIIDLITSGGLGGQIIMITLGTLSILTVYFFMERLQVIQRAVKDDPQFMSKVKDYLSDRKIESVVSLCNRSSSAVANMVAKGVVAKGNANDVKDAMERQGNLEVYKLEHNLSSLATIAGAAPMIGFLGTVIGMILAFHEMASAGGQIDVEMLSKGIYTAMTTTVAGLIVGIVAYLAYNQLVAKVTKATFKMDQGTAEFLEVISDNK
ncbi:MAG: MotA/TolQ/ExbB proton channel family protein [Flavobacteriales bacterium]|jgi:biopolymer transport protein ExbB|nr:MotA/TolQ/ExbB proton channel family protein [Flavobacteriales bacterium]